MTAETSLKSVIKEYLDLMRVFNYPVRQGLGCYRGLPDRVMHFQGQVHYLEIKTPKGRLTDSQVKFQGQCQADKVPYHVVRTLEDIQVILLNQEGQ